jgi:hypothetical protein
MALHRVNPLNDQTAAERRTETASAAACPICEGKMNIVYERNSQTVSVCASCHTDVTAFGAWTIARRVPLDA